MNSDDSFFSEPADDKDDDDDDGTIKPITAKDVDPKLKAKYAFLFKSREDLTPQERRWAWVKISAYPEELTNLIESLKKKKVTKKVDKDKTKDDKEEDDLDKEDFITEVKGRDDLLIDYTVIENVTLKLEDLALERKTAKYNAQFHSEIYDKMLEQMPKESNDNKKTRIEIIILLVSSKFIVSRSAI